VSTALQRGRRRRLRQADPVGGTADMGLVQKCVEHDEEIEIKRP
jgi:hypothetical protein